MKCEYCSEEILEGQRSPNLGGDFHVECLFRMVGGSVGHIQKRCTCFGGNAGDPPEMTKRQAAKAAMDEWQKLQLQGRLMGLRTYCSNE